MKKYFIYFLFVFTLIGCGQKSVPKPDDNINSTIENPAKNQVPVVLEQGKEVVFDNIKEGDTLKFPFVLKGKAGGSWFFEGSTAAYLLDDKEQKIAFSLAKVEGNWMTSDAVNFSATFDHFKTQPIVNNGFLVLEKSNPSGLKENDKNFRIPVVFEKEVEREKVMIPAKVFFGNTQKFHLAPVGSARDEQTSRQLCAKVYPVARKIEQMPMPNLAKKTLEKLLFNDSVSAKEASVNLVSGIVVPGVKIKSFTLENGVLKMDLSREILAAEKERKLFATDGGYSCWPELVKNQITQTLLQFKEVKSVIITVEGEELR